MNEELESAIKTELEIMGAYLSVPAADTKGGHNAVSRNQEQFTNKVETVVEYLADAPHSSAQRVSEKFNMPSDEIKLVYTIIQQSDAIHDYFKASHNKDYFDVAHHYFTNHMLVLVFFVGFHCPCRCLFCPNVSINANGTRELVTYTDKAAKPLDHQAIAAIFKDIALLKKQGIDILVKISGGLEPLADVEMMNSILEEASAITVPVKIYTNGVLLDSAARRQVALKARDIRISLSSINERQYEYVLFGEHSRLSSKYSLRRLIGNLEHLVKERNHKERHTRIGINTVILKENYQDIREFIHLAENIGLDYIDFKPDYFAAYEKDIGQVIAQEVGEIKEEAEKGKHGSLDLYFANSISEKNVFWKHRDGMSFPHKQARFKLFISPYGLCTPIHYGAFPSAEEIRMHKTNIYCSGIISPENSLLDILNSTSELPPLENSKLNPFELMLSLELERVEQDLAWGIPPEYNPYIFSHSERIPEDISSNRALQNLFGV